MKDLERCRTCGGVLERRGDYFVCQSCGHKYEVDITDNATLIDKEHAWSVFRSMDFEKAIDLFESIVSKQPDNYEAHWGLALSMAEVFFTLDKDKNKMIPTMLSISESSFVENKNVQKAISLAPKAISEGYAEVAAYIEKVRVEWIEKASKQAPFDVFISFKASDGEDKHKTSDLDAARDIYDILRDQKYNVFFSPITLKGKAGEEFEPYIYNAIQTAKVMIVYGEKAEYYTSTWIKNEWSRYKKMIESGKKHKDSLFVVSKGVKPEDISPSLVRGREILHADDMRFSEILKLQVKRVIDEVEQSKKLSKKEVEAKKREKKDTLPKNAADRRKIGGAGAETSIDEKESLSLIPFYISQGQWDAALALVNDVLSKNASCAEAMWNKMMLDRKYRSEAELIGKLSELSADEFNMIDEMLRCAGREFAAHMLDLLYDSGKTLNSSVYERVLRLVLPYDYPSREGKIKEAIERSIKNSELAIFTMLLDSLDSNAVEDYKNYNFKYIQTTPNREEKKTCANKILEVEDNIEAYNIIYQYHFEGSRRSEDMVSAFETMLQYTDVGERAGVVCRAIDEAAKKMRSSAQCECAYEIIGFYPGDTKEIKDKILMLADAALQLELYDQARHLYNIVSEVDPRNVSARWGICLARVHARNESEVIRSDRPLIQQQPDFNKFLSLLGEADRKKYGALTIKQEKHHKSKNKRLVVTLLAIAAAIALCVGVFFAVKAINDANYNNAISLLEQGDYEGAYSLLEGVFGYEDADKYIEILDNVSLLGESEDIKATLAALSDLGVSVEISYDAKGGSSRSSQSFAGGDEISFVTPERTGYEFEKWSYVSHSYKFKNQTVSISLAASWTASKNTEYRVSYYIEDEKTGEFSLHSTVSHQGETDASVTPAPMSIDGYATPEAITAKIAADGSLEIKYYYYSKNTQYIVNHYVENVGDEGYTLESSETLKGTTNSSVTPGTRSYSGYVSPAKQTVTILPGGTLVVDYYYQRADYTITVVPNCETSSYEVGFKWGDQFNIVDPERSGYTFGGWYTDVELTVPYLPEISSSVTIYAHWLEETKASDFTYDGADEYTILGYQGQGASITVPAYIGGKPVRRIIDGAFADNKTITDVVIPDTVNRIGYAAFAGCTALKNITVPFIGESESATEGYNTTLGFIFGDKNPTDGGYASSSSTHYTSGNYGYTSQAQDTGYTSSTYYYYYLIPKSLKSVTVTRQTSIPECAFKNCDLLESITIPEGVTSIGACALMGCENLLSLNSTTAGEVNVPNGVTTIAYKAFSYLYAITAINLPENVKTIEDYAFYGCSKVSAYNGKANALELPDGLKSVGALAFYNNSLIKTIVVPDSVTTIGWAAFGGCSSLESLTVPFIGESMSATTEYNITLGHFFGDKS
ncbi:MAG: leucine-rich repeat protein, partial [Clostridia bacterium]|nr:leucine-rich repeat protein [Clostridia bacterium]